MVDERGPMPSNTLVAYAAGMHLSLRRAPTNVFVLGTGRCGTMTVTKACGHLANFTVGHESRAHAYGEARFAYPARHIEADNRLSWFLGDLDSRFGGKPLYVHLRRNPGRVAASFERRWGRGIIGAFHGAVVLGGSSDEERLKVCRFYVDTVTANIEMFLKDKPRVMTVWIEEHREWFPSFWARIGGDGDLEAAMAEFHSHHNASSR